MISLPDMLTEELNDFSLGYFADIMNYICIRGDIPYHFDFEIFNEKHFYLITITHEFASGKIEETIIEPLKHDTLFSCVETVLNLVNKARKVYNDKHN